ncbi:MAG: HAMP domain-containing sensor histidine kinase [Actinomycetota bacterium]|nr:HAMP domain-containing sensor histidine kinase [Actinomycetota bacterium]
MNPSPARLATRIFLVLLAVLAVATASWLAIAEVGPREPFDMPYGTALVVGGAVSFAIAAVVSWFLARRIARPIAELADAAETIADGRYGVQVPRAKSSAELQRLSDAFARMSARLSDTEASRIRLLSDLAHEIRTPLATLEAYIDGLEDGVVPADPAAWSTMRDQVLRLRRLTADLRETAAAEEHALGLQLQTTDLARVVTAAVEAVVPRFRAKGVHATTAGTDRPVLVRADADRLQQVLANLLDNALRHTPGGGHVVVSLATEGRRAVIRVSDDGDGIPPDQLDAIFARFHRVDASRTAADGSGSGLGLTIARAIITDHGGTITASSDGPGRGATFTITLTIPAARSPKDPIGGPSPGRGR